MAREVPKSEPLPEGWRVPTEREYAQAMALKLRNPSELRYFRDGWRRWIHEMWWPCDPYGRKTELCEVIRDGRTKLVGKRKPIKPLDEGGKCCLIHVEQDEDQTQEPERRVYRDRTGEILDEPTTTYPPRYGDE